MNTPRPRGWTRRSVVARSTVLLAAPLVGCGGGSAGQSGTAAGVNAGVAAGVTGSVAVQAPGATSPAPTPGTQTGGSVLENSALGRLAASLQPGQSASLSCPSLTAPDATGSLPWLPPAASGSDVGLLDWCSNLPLCESTLQFVATGGRPSSNPAAQKLIRYGIADHQWTGVANPFGTSGGHLYQSQCIASELERFFHVNISGDQLVRVWNTREQRVEETLARMPGNRGDAICLMWHPALGSRGSLLAAGSVAQRQYCLRHDWALRAWTTLLDEPDPEPLFGLGGHFAGIWIPQARACLFGNSGASLKRNLKIVHTDGRVRNTAPPPGDLSVFNGHGVLTPHPQRASALHLCPATGRLWEYSVERDAWSDLGPLAPAFRVAQQVGATVAALGVVVTVSGGSTPVGREMHVLKP